MTLKKYLTTAEVAAVCRASPETVRYWRFTSRGPKSFRVGRRVLYAEEDVARWLEEREAAEHPTTATA
jgi:predicted DNA-binding transcriptional regulator AlpA